MFNLNTPFRAFQAVLAIICVGMNGYVTSWYLHHTHPSANPNEFTFMIFVACWTLLLLPYLFLNPPLSQTHHHKPPGRYFNKWAVLALDSITGLFWFTGFVAVAVFKHRLILCYGHVCAITVGAIVVGAIAWLTFLGTTVLAMLHVVRTRGGGASGQSHAGWIGSVQV